MAKIVVSYRRSQNSAIAASIAKALGGHYGSKSVFIDVINLRIGKDYHQQIFQALRFCDVLLVVIGPKWKGKKGDQINIANANDPVRIEVETAINLHIPIVPVLVDGAKMPKKEELPESLWDLLRLHAADIDSTRDFERDMERTIRDMDETIPGLKPKTSRRIPMYLAWCGKFIFGWMQGHESRAVALGITALGVLSGGAFQYFGPPHIFKTQADGTSKPEIRRPKIGEAEIGAGGQQGGLVEPIPVKTAAVRSIVFAPNRATFAVGGDDGVIRLWDANSFVLIRRFIGHRGSVRKVAFSADGSKLVSASFDKKVIIWDVATGAQQGEALEAGGEMPGTGLLSLAVFPSQPIHYIMAGGSDGVVRIWDIEKNQKFPVKSRLAFEREQDKYHEVFSLSFAPNGSGDYAAGGRLGPVKIYSTAESNPKVMNTDGASIFHVQYSTTGTMLLAAGAGGFLKVWDLHSDQQARAYSGATETLLAATWSSDKKWLAAGGVDRKVRVWEVDKQEPVRLFTQHNRDVETIAFHPNGKWLLSGSEDGTLKVWDLQSLGESKDPLLTFVAFKHDDNIDEYVAFKSNGLFTGSSDSPQSVKFVFVENGAEKNLANDERRKLFTAPDSTVSLLKQ